MRDVFETIGSHNSKRDEWTFKYTANELSAAAAEKHRYHKSRVVWWTAKKGEVMTAIKETGIEISESIVDELAKSGYSTANNNMNAMRNGPQVKVNEDLVRKLMECVSKIAAHEVRVSTYEGWNQALCSAPAPTAFDLNINDWLFFFGK